MCCIKCLLLSGPWRLTVWLDEFTAVFVEPFHPDLAEATVRAVLPFFPKPRPTCEFFTYFCLIWPLEYYRKCTGRDKLSIMKLFRHAACFLFEAADMFDPSDFESLISMPDWKYYMLKGSWPWEEQEELQTDDESDEDDED